jgi:acyl carrier protein
MPETSPIRSQIKRLLVDALHLEGLVPSEIADDGPLFGDGLGLDSVDALELVVALEREFGIRIQSHDVGKEAFTSVATLAAFIEGRLAAERAPADRTPGARSPDAGR